MENTRVAILGIIISDMDSVEPVNALLHENSPYIIGRMEFRTGKGESISSASSWMHPTNHQHPVRPKWASQRNQLQGDLFQRVRCEKRDNTPCRPSSVVRGRFISILLIPN